MREGAVTNQVVSGPPVAPPQFTPNMFYWAPIPATMMNFTLPPINQEELAKLAASVQQPVQQQAPPPQPPPQAPPQQPAQPPVQPPPRQNRSLDEVAAEINSSELNSLVARTKTLLSKRKDKEIHKNLTEFKDLDFTIVRALQKPHSNGYKTLILSFKDAPLQERYDKVAEFLGALPKSAFL